MKMFTSPCKARVALGSRSPSLLVQYHQENDQPVIPSTPTR
jgi:hypothetical protein